MKSAGKARSNGLYRHIRTSKEIIRNLLNDSYIKIKNHLVWSLHKIGQWMYYISKLTDTVNRSLG